VARNLRFKQGELVEVRSTFKVLSSFGGVRYGPDIRGKITANSTLLVPGATFLTLSDSTEAGHQQNHRLWIEILTNVGPRVVWSSVFKMRPIKEENNHVV
jgi:hypothetical protein